MKIEQLIQVVEIAKTSSITFAAKNLFMSQSNLSTSIKELEKEMGRKIFTRSNNGTQLTPFGEEFLEQARMAVKQFEYIKNMSSTQGEKVEDFSVASYYFLFSVYIFTEIFNKSQIPNIDFCLKDGSRSQVIKAVAEKEAELGILSIPTFLKEQYKEWTDTKKLEYHCISKEKAYILIGKGSPFCPQDIREIRMKDLYGYSFVDFIETDKRLIDLKAEYIDLLHPKHRVLVSDRGSMINFLRNTDCYHIATKNTKAYQEYAFHEHIKAIPLVDCPFDFEIMWIKTKDGCLSRLAKEFLIKVQEMLILESAEQIKV